MIGRRNVQFVLKLVDDDCMTWIFPEIEGNGSEVSSLPALNGGRRRTLDSYQVANARRLQGARGFQPGSIDMKTSGDRAPVHASALAAVSVAIFVVAGSHAARADDSASLLKAMTDYTAAQKSITATFDSSIEVITPELEKIQFASSGQLQLSRPDKLRVKRTGGYADVELVYDGKTVSLYGNNAKAYVQADVAGTIDHLVDALQGRTGGALPGTDLLLTDAYDLLTSDVIDGHHVGQGVVNGVECEHLAFRGHDTDWQIWIQTGAQPIPRKYVITSKTLAGAPQYTLQIKDWKTDPISDANAFAFKPPEGATKVSLDSEEMSEFDEVPPGTTEGAKK
jgi:hypothetical protein